MNKKGQDQKQMTGFVMRGGIDSPTDTPDCRYWRNSAMWAKAEIYDMFPGECVEIQIARILGKFYNPENTWMAIYHKTVRCLDLMKALQKENTVHTQENS